jgi:hypothetical protein
MVRIIIEADTQRELRETLETLAYISVSDGSPEEQAERRRELLERFRRPLPEGWKMTRDEMHER